MLFQNMHPVYGDFLCKKLDSSLNWYKKKQVTVDLVYIICE